MDEFRLGNKEEGMRTEEEIPKRLRFYEKWLEEACGIAEETLATLNEKRSLLRWVLEEE